MNEQEHLSVFVSTIHTRASQESGAIRTETEQYRTRKMDELRKELSAGRKKAILDAQASAVRLSGQAISDAVRASAEAISEKQLSIRDSVFEKVYARLLAFTESPEYQAYLKKTAERLAEMFIGSPVRIHFAERDSEIVQSLLPLFASGSELVSDASVRLGGLCAYSADGKKCVDATLDQSVEQHKRVFAETSGLDVS